MCLVQRAASCFIRFGDQRLVIMRVRHVPCSRHSKGLQGFIQQSAFNEERNKIKFNPNKNMAIWQEPVKRIAVQKRTVGMVETQADANHSMVRPQMMHCGRATEKTRGRDRDRAETEEGKKKKGFRHVKHQQEGG